MSRTPTGPETETSNPTWGKGSVLQKQSPKCFVLRTHSGRMFGLPTSTKCVGTIFSDLIRP